MRGEAKGTLNAEIQHFVLRFNKISLLKEDTTKRGVRG